MKSAGLSSNYRTMLKKTTKITATAAYQGNHLAAKEKKRTLRIQAEQAQRERQKRENPRPPENAIEAPVLDEVISE